MDIVDLIPEVGQVVRRCPGVTLKTAYLRSARNFCSQTRWLRDTPTLDTLSGNTEAGTADYALLVTDPLTEIVGIRDVKGFEVSAVDQWWQITPFDKTRFQPTTQTNKPVHYAYVPEASLSLWMAPDKAYRLEITAAVQPILTATELPDRLVTKWKEVLEYGALEYLMALPRQAWSNAVIAADYGKKFRAGINNAKADEQRGYNQGPTRVTPRMIFRRKI